MDHDQHSPQLSMLTGDNSTSSTPSPQDLDGATKRKRPHGKKGAPPVLDIDSQPKVVGSAAPNTPTTINLWSIALDKSLQVRNEICNKTVNEYAQRMAAGDQFPPVTVFRRGIHFVLIDGLHRYHAAQQAGLFVLNAHILEGGKEEAVRVAITANNAHGLPLTNKDKKRAVGLALKEFAGASDRQIADWVKVSPTFVGKVRSQLSIVDSCELRKGKDGKMRKPPTRGAHRSERTELPDNANQESSNNPPSAAPENMPQMANPAPSATAQNEVLTTNHRGATKTPHLEPAPKRRPSGYSGEHPKAAHSSRQASAPHVEETDQYGKSMNRLATSTRFDVDKERKKLEEDLARAYAQWPEMHRPAFKITLKNFLLSLSPESKPRK